jgi:hypothetical protein
MDLESQDRWVDFSPAKDEMFAQFNIPEAPWFTVEADDKRRARLNCIRQLFSKVPYEDVAPDLIGLPPRKAVGNYRRPPLNEHFLYRIVMADCCDTTASRAPIDSDQPMGPSRRPPRLFSKTIQRDRP